MDTTTNTPSLLRATPADAAAHAARLVAEQAELDRQLAALGISYAATTRPGAEQSGGVEAYARNPSPVGKRERGFWDGGSAENQWNCSSIAELAVGYAAPGGNGAPPG